MSLDDNSRQQIYITCNINGGLAINFPNSYYNSYCRGTKINSCFIEKEIIIVQLIEFFI